MNLDLHMALMSLQSQLTTEITDRSANDQMLANQLQQVREELDALKEVAPKLTSEALEQSAAEIDTQVLKGIKFNVGALQLGYAHDPLRVKAAELAVEYIGNIISSDSAIIEDSFSFTKLAEEILTFLQGNGDAAAPIGNS